MSFLLTQFSRTRTNCTRFDGHAHLHNLYFEDGKAYYTNQFVPCQRYLLEEDLSPILERAAQHWDLLMGAR